MNQLLRLFKLIFSLNERRGTIRYMFPAIISFAAILSAAVVMSSDTSYVRLVASDTAVETGNSFKVDVYANAHVAVNAVDITLQFDPAVVDVAGVDKGQSVLTLWTEEPMVKDGKVTLRGGTYRRGFVGEHKIATINLKAKVTGQSNFSVADVVLLAGDGKGTPVSIGKTKDSSVGLYIYDENTNLNSIGVNVAVGVITDIDGSGNVNLKDVSSFMAAWADKKTLYDFNGDGSMNFRDFSIILSDFFFN